jgi:phenylacetate-CoA ligase
MHGIETINKFIQSSRIIEQGVRELLERLPVRFRYGISYGPTFRYWLGFLKASENWTKDEIEAYQIEQLRDLTIHARKNIPYYRELFHAYSFNPEKIHCLDDLKSLPLLERETVRNRIGDFIDVTIPKSKLISVHTSGSTGNPLTLYGTKETEEKHWATVVNLWSRVGYHPRARLVSFQNISFGTGSPPIRKVANTLLISRNCFDTSWMKKFVVMIRAFKPEFIYGFPSHLSYFCHLMESGHELPLEGVKAVLTDSEGINTWQRGIIEQMCGARVFLSYGMVEKALYGGPCNQSNEIHLYPQYGIVETVDHSNAEKEIIGTGFINRAMPLIRYQTSDFGEIGACCQACGRFYPIIKAIDGRAGDYLIDRSGNVISTLMLGHRSGCFDHVRMYQFYQEERGKVVLRIVRNKTYTEKDTLRIQKELKRELEITNNFDISIKFVDDLEKTPTGKTRVVVQKLAINDIIKNL